MRYFWQQAEWPQFEFDLSRVNAALLSYARHSSRVGGLLDALPDGLEAEAVIDLMIDEAIKSSAIEGETLERNDVMSSIKNHLGLNIPHQPVGDKLAEGAGRLMVDVRSTFPDKLSEETLFRWHTMLLGQTPRIRVGGWRQETMQVVSGRLDKPTIHFEAPPADRVPAEMAAFIAWFNATAPGGASPIEHAPVRAALAHLYFETIHPFDDGNGRIGRAISEKALAQGLGRPVLLSLSRTIEANRSNYYDALKAAQARREVTDWITYFVGTTVLAQLDAETQITFIVQKSKFFQKFSSQLNERQLKAIRKVFDAGPGGFIGGINARKYLAITKASRATATRDLQDLVKMGALTPIGAGRSSSYEINL